MTERRSIKPDGMDNVTIRMPDKLRRDLTERAADEGRTLSQHVRMILERHTTTRQGAP